MQAIETKAVKTFRAPSDYGNRCAFTVTAEVHGEPPYFAVGGDIYNKSVRTRNGDGTQACGCLHDEAAKAWPKIKPIIDLHLSNAETGEPMHAEVNGFYWLAGAVGGAGLGEQYHGGSGSDGRTPDKCLEILADHLRITQAEARVITDKVKNAYYDAEIKAIDEVKIEPTLNRSPQGMETVRKAASIAARNVFHDFVVAQRDRWQAEAEAGIALIQSLSTNGIL